MKSSDLPKLMPVAFGVNGQRQDLQSSSVSGTSLASYDAGFPPITMIDKSAGGIPPQGKDFNQILYELSADAKWNQASGIYPYSSVFSSDIGGYPQGALVIGPDGTSVYQSLIDNNTYETSSTSWSRIATTSLLGSTTSGEGMSLSIAEDGTNGQEFYNNADQFSGAYEDGSITISSINRWITYGGERWYVNPSATIPFTTSGVDATSWATDKGNFLVFGDKDLRNEISSNIGEIILGRVPYCSDLLSIDPTSEGKKVTVIEFESGSYTGGGDFISKLSSEFTADSGKVFASSNSTYVWVRVEYLANQPIHPEWYGCRGLGSSFPDTTYFANMISGLVDGDFILLGMGKEYYNDSPASNQWLITKNSITIFGQSSTLSKRAMTSSDSFGLVLDVNNVSGFCIGGRLKINGNEPLSEIYDSSGVSLNSGVNYCNSPVQSFCLRVQNSTNIVIEKGVSAERAVFLGFVNGCSKVNIAGDYQYSGQVYPLSSSDLALGSAWKINNCTNIIGDISCNNCAYAGFEMEGNNAHGNLKCVSSYNYESGIHFQNTNTNFKVESVAYNNNQYSLFLGLGSVGVIGDATGYSCGTVCFAYGDVSYVTMINKINVININSTSALNIYGTSSGNNVELNDFNVLSSTTSTTGSMVQMSYGYYNKIEYRGSGGTRCMSANSGNFNDITLKFPYGNSSVYQGTGWTNNYDITSMTSESADNATRYVLRYEQAVVEGAPSTTGNSPESMATRSNLKNYSQYVAYPNLPQGTTIPSGVPVGGWWIDTSNGNVLKMRTS